MLTDIFTNRYGRVRLWERYEEPDRRFLVQAFRIVADQLYPYYSSDGRENETSKIAWKTTHDKLSMELGLKELSASFSSYYMTWQGKQTLQTHMHTMLDICENFVTAKFEETTTADQFMKDRISFVEIAFRERSDQVAAANAELSSRLSKARLEDMLPRRPGHLPGGLADSLKFRNDVLNTNFRLSMNELNTRFRQAGYSLNYHNGYVQLSPDNLVEEQIEGPFWSLLSKPAWKNVDFDMKEAIDRRDQNGRDPAFYAARALESAIKIISGEKGWTHGGEKGAHSFADNLRSKKNGEFINDWEMKVLKEFFSAVRNPFGHGPGASEMPSLNMAQTDWAIEFCMIWIKNLIRRM